MGGRGRGRSFALLLAVAIAAALAGAACRNTIDAAGGAPTNTSVPPASTPTLPASPTPTPTVVPTPAPVTLNLSGGAVASVNKCARIVDASSNGNVVVASDALLGIGTGTEVLLLQVTDSVPLPATEPAAIADVGEAGLFDDRIVALATTGGTSTVSLTLDRVPSISYSSNASGRAAEICSVPYFDTLTIGNASVSARAWDGTSGGIVAFRVNSLVMNNGAVLDATGAGFAGGFSDGVFTSSPTSTVDCAANVHAGDKGGTFTPYPANAVACVGAKRTGGGGGDATNDGGGGGGLGGAGGIGGAGPNGAASSSPGHPGAPVSIGVWGGASGRLLFGGGGGGGTPKGNGTDGNGGRGGGVILVLGTASTLLNAGGILAADGKDGMGVSGNAGAGGGGAGGTIFVESSSPGWDSVPVEVNGGEGADAPFPDGTNGDGPGGGGGGGIVLWVGQPPSNATATAGGAGKSADGSSNGGAGGLDGPSPTQVQPVPSP